MAANIFLHTGFPAGCSAPLKHQLVTWNISEGGNPFIPGRRGRSVMVSQAAGRLACSTKRLLFL